MSEPAIAVLGSGGTTDEGLLRAAREVGAGLARRGAAVVVGGTGGVFAAACEGARAAGGPALALLGEARKPADAGADALLLATGLGAARHAVMACACDGAIVIEGWAPTLAIVAEFAALGKPVVALRGTGGAAGAAAGHPLIAGGKARILAADTPAEAVEMLMGR